MNCAVVDRLVQQAITQELTPLYEVRFSDMLSESIGSEIILTFIFLCNFTTPTLFVLL